MRGVGVAIGACLLMLVPLAAASHPWLNGVSSYRLMDPTYREYDAPIFRQFAFVEGTVTEYHVFNPFTLLTDHHTTKIYQFPACSTLDPVLENHHPSPGDGGFWDVHDAPTRNIVNVALATGCSRQPTSVDEVLALAVQVAATPFWVNAPRIPDQLQDMADNVLFNAPPFRPRVEGWMDGREVQFLTYEANWHPTWVGTRFFTQQDADVFVLSYGAIFRHGFSILNHAAGSPHHRTFQSYAPIWRANCLVDADNPKCMVSVNLQQPLQENGLGYWQCKSVAECRTMKNYNDKSVLNVAAVTFTHINCPMVAVDLNGDNYISAAEEIKFPDLWVNGPVLPAGGGAGLEFLELARQPTR